MVTDELGSLAALAHEAIEDLIESEDRQAIENFIVAAADNDDSKRVVSESKLRRYATWVLAGIIVGDWFNSRPWHHRCREAA